MPKAIVQRIALVIVVAATTIRTSTQIHAQSYPVDCAILLCLSGGWPASAACVHARVEFIRRITPWPVEPPLQIWRCPMASYLPTKESERSNTQSPSIRFDDVLSTQNEATATLRNIHRQTPEVLGGSDAKEGRSSRELGVQRPQLNTNIDVSGPVFSFVRSIRVFHIRYARQFEADREGDCHRGDFILLGTYNSQGDFSWQRASVAALPRAILGLDQWGKHCPTISHRAVFVDWRDYNGNYGFEQVNY